MRRHFVIPDAQVRPGSPTDHLEWIGKAIVEYAPDTVVCLGDFADMHSLSSYKSALESEGARYWTDIIAAREAMDVLMAPLKSKWGAKLHRPGAPRLVLTLGNHEHRIQRAIDQNPVFDTAIGMHNLPYEDWEVYDFLEQVTIDGVTYCHFFQKRGSGGAVSGMIETRTKTIGYPFVQGHQQGLKTGMHEKSNGELVRGLVAGSCLHPDHKVLTADLRYVPLRNLSVGDELVSFDEHPGGRGGARSLPRRYKTGRVTALRLSKGPMFDVTLSSGKVFRATADHRWLVKDSNGPFRWVRTDELRTTREECVGNKGGGHRVVKLLDEWEHDTSWESGWLAGMYCGEGCLYARETSGGWCMQLSLHQSNTHNPSTCERLASALRSVAGVGVDRKVWAGREVGSHRIEGGSRNIVRVLGTVRPPRMLEKFRPEMMGSVGGKSTPCPEVVLSVSPAGEDEYLEIEIDAGTMVVEGYGHHNCYLHDEDYMGQTNSGHWRGCLVLNDVHHGMYNLMELDLDYLCRRWGTGDHVWKLIKKKYPALYRKSSWAQSEQVLRAGGAGPRDTPRRRA